MGEIPNWLIELAESADNDDNEENQDAVPSEVTIRQPEQQPRSGFLEEPVTLMDELRSQVVEETFPDDNRQKEFELEKSFKPIAFAGMLPWQLAVLSFLLFVDIAVVGLLFLAMLGRISFP